MTEKIIEKKSVAEVIGNFIAKNRKIVIGICCALLVVVLGYAIAITVNSKAVESGLEKIDEITYSLTNKSFDLTEDELSKRMDTALNEINSFASKGGIVGVRANMLIAEIYFQKKDFEKARSAWLLAAEKGKKTYTAALSYFNAAVCSEELSDVDSALKYYNNCLEDVDFLEKAHVLFSIGRIQESKQSFAEAKDAYQKLVDSSPDVSWAKLAKNRLIALKTEGKID